jgi:hypothetical protein
MKSYIGNLSGFSSAARQVDKNMIAAYPSGPGRENLKATYYASYLVGI